MLAEVSCDCESTTTMVFTCDNISQKMIRFKKRTKKSDRWGEIGDRVMSRYLWKVQNRREKAQKEGAAREDEGKEVSS
jgi:hypothetical protein